MRRELRDRRLALSSKQQRLHSRSVARHFITSRYFLRCRSIAIYLTNDGELDPAPLALEARHAGKKVYLPVLRPRPDKALWFCEYRTGDPLYPNRFGIPEPDIRRRKIHPPWALDIVLLPLVAFDIHGNRLGMGGGYYDRTFSFLLNRRHWVRPPLIGVAHECQKVEQIHSRPWDIPLNAVITENGFYNKVQKSKKIP
jgi:5-formyltetrahydrofolate cyclo-ligase